MKLWKPITIAITLAAAMAVMVSLSAQDNSSPETRLMTGDGGRSDVIVYGDSREDNGNIYKLLGFPGPPYWNGRWSNGPVAVDNLSAILGMPLLDYAYAAATTGLGNIIDGGTVEQLGGLGVPGITTAYNTTINSIPRDTIHRALFVVSGGANDFTTDGLTTTTADRAAANLVAIVTDLQNRGARWILVPGLSDLGMSPSYTSQGPETAALATSLSRYLNKRLIATLPKGVLYFDTFRLYHAMRDYPGAFGLTNVVDPCYDFFNGGPVCANPDQHLFWDSLGHPPEHVQIILAARFAFAAYGLDLFKGGR
jgi:GDSL-like Lipase/Acylhydrolase